MLKRTLICTVFVMCVSSAHAMEYMNIRCSDLADEPNWAAHVVGWLNLQNRDQVTQNIDFRKASEQALSLQRTCTAMPDLALHQAVTMSFSEIEDEGLAGPAAVYTYDVVGSIAR